MKQAPNHQENQMLGLPKYDEKGKLKSGYLWLNDPVVQQNWIKRLRRIGFTYIMTYHDVQGRFSLTFSR